MQFNITTDYAIRAVVILAIENRKMTAEEISQQMKIPLNYLRKLMKRLNKGGILDVQRGCFGGFSLSKGPEEITLYDIITIIEPTLKINRCMEKECYCSRNAVPTCPVRILYTEVQALVEDILKSCSVKDLIDLM